jgi:hypothetical protein
MAFPVEEMASADSPNRNEILFKNAYKELDVQAHACNLLEG